MRDHRVRTYVHTAQGSAVVIAPSNPYHAIRPILEVNGMKEFIRKRGVMRELGQEPSARALATEYLRTAGDRLALARSVLYFAGKLRK